MRRVETLLKQVENRKISKRRLKMNERKKLHFDSSIIVGLIIVAVGVFLLLDRFDVQIGFNPLDFWPLILVAIGLSKLVQPRRSGDMFWGVVLIIIGGLFQLNNLGYIHFWFGDLWPVMIIILGFFILRGSIFRSNWKGHCRAHIHTRVGDNDTETVILSERKQDYSSDHVNVSTVMGSVEYVITSKQFQGGKASAVMGAVELDFRDAVLGGDEVVMVADSVMGSVEMRVPREWEVVVQGTPFMGALEDKTVTPPNGGKKFIVKGSAIMGTIEVKN